MKQTTLEVKERVVSVSTCNRQPRDDQIEQVVGLLISPSSK